MWSPSGSDDEGWLTNRIRRDGTIVDEQEYPAETRSFAGLVKKLGGHKRVRKLVLMGTPVFGTWLALAGVLTFVALRVLGVTDPMMGVKF